MTQKIYATAAASFARLPATPDSDKLHAIARAAEDVHGFTLEDLRGLDRRPPLLHVRQEAMLLAYEQKIARTVIGAFFRRDPTTVIAAVKSATKRRKENT